METYIVELTAEERQLALELARVIDTIRGGDKRLQGQLSSKLRNAQPVQPSALERLEEWCRINNRGKNVALVIDQDGSALCLIRQRYYYGYGFPNAINAALDAAEEGRNAEVS